VGFIIGMVVAVGCILGGFAAMGGRVAVIWQPWEFVIICGASIGTFIVANPMPTIKDTGVAMMDAILDHAPTQRHYLDVLGVLYTLMRELRGKARNEIEEHVDNPSESAIFKSFPKVLADKDLTHFIWVSRDKLKAFHALTSVAEALPALGICAAVLGVIKAMGALDEAPEILGHLIRAALVGTFAGIFMSYGLVQPIAMKVKTIREQRCRLYIIVKQTLLAFMNGAMPQIALEHGRKTISSHDRPSIDMVENETVSGGAGKTDEQQAA
jgi:chemotaxis protein MotA